MQLSEHTIRQDMHPFTLIKNIFQKSGIYGYRAANLSRQIDLWHDVREILSKPEVVFDVGANVGLFAKTANKECPETQIYSFEPVSNSFARLRKLAKKKPTIHPQKLAMGSTAGKALISICENSQWNSLIKSKILEAAQGKIETVDVSTVDSFCVSNKISRINLLKTDTEGFDNKVSIGSQRMLHESRIRAVYSEVTFCAGDSTHTQYESVYDTLKRLNFAFYGLCEPGGAGLSMYSNALFVQKELLGMTP